MALNLGRRKIVTGALAAALSTAAAAPAMANDTAPTSMAVEKVTAEQAYQRSAGGIVFMDAEDLSRLERRSTASIIQTFADDSGIPFAVIPIIAHAEKPGSYLCFNAEGCLPVIPATRTTLLAGLKEHAKRYGLKVSDTPPSSDLDNE